MTRSLAAVIAITLGLPILAMIAVTATGSMSPDLLMTLLIGGAVMIFIVGAIFEIKRLADLDDHARSAQADIILSETLATAKVYATPPATTGYGGREANAPVAVRPIDPIEVEVRQDRTSETVPLVLAAKLEAQPIVARAKPRGSKRNASTPKPVMAPEEIAPVLAESRRKRGPAKSSRKPSSE
jgi:hypothetical protein